MPGNKMGEMPTLDEHNAQKFLAEKALRRTGAGVACPACHTEMELTHPGQVNASLPPSENVRCPACGRRGLKF